MRPALTAALTAWREDWAEERRRALMEGQQLLKRDQMNKEARHAEELAAKDEEIRRLTEEFGVGALSKEQEHAKALAAQAEAAHEARVQHLMQAAAKRMMQAGLTKG